MRPTAERGGNQDRRRGQGPQKGGLFRKPPEREAERRRDERQILDQRHEGRLSRVRLVKRLPTFEIDSTFGLIASSAFLLGVENVVSHKMQQFHQRPEGSPRTLIAHSADRVVHGVIPRP